MVFEIAAMGRLNQLIIHDKKSRIFSENRKAGCVDTNDDVFDDVFAVFIVDLKCIL